MRTPAATPRHHHLAPSALLQIQSDLAAAGDKGGPTYKLRLLLEQGKDVEQAGALWLGSVCSGRQLAAAVRSSCAGLCVCRLHELTQGHGSIQQTVMTTRQAAQLSARPATPLHATHPCRVPLPAP